MRYKVQGAEIIHLRTYWLQISSMLIQVIFDKFFGKEDGTHTLQFDL